MVEVALAATCPCCDGPLDLAWTYDAPPEGETRFAALEGRPYRRDVHRCRSCEHHCSRPPLDPDELYRDAYVHATYGPAGLQAAFERIMALPPGRSDNRERVERVLEFAERRMGRRTGRALDVGSGLAVFPAALVAAGWRCDAVDPDPRAAAHARAVAGVPAICAAATDLPPEPVYDLVTLNKVIEHVERPALLLDHVAGSLAPGGALYVEVPDGPAAARQGPVREEFFIEHFHAFSARSLKSIAGRAGLRTLECRALLEPSGKYTLAAFLAPERSGA